MYKAIIIGATGIVGQQFITALQNHPRFEITGLAASKNSAGKKYIDAIKNQNGSIQWFCKEQSKTEINNMIVEDGDVVNPEKFDIAFSALETNAAQRIEPRFAKFIPVLSTASAFRYEKDVPILVPGVNNEHIQILHEQKKRGWNGFISPQANCTTTGLAFTLKPIKDKFGIESVIMTSLQAVSGAGRSPGIAVLDLVDNIIPYIPQEEEKVSIEALKILGQKSGEVIQNASFKVSSTCTRVNVLDGHTESVLVITSNKAEVDEIKDVMKSFSNCLSNLDLPSAPNQLLTIMDDPFRPQPRLDRDSEGGMTTSIGRIRKDEVFPNGIKYVLVSHNTRMGAAKGTVLMAEILVKEKMIHK